MKQPLLRRRRRKLIQSAVRQWYVAHGRHFPWRNIRDPYRILLSEIMLQQTQVGRVLEKYPRFLRRFPTLRSLAKAQQRDVVIAWRGMGYNNRAVRLHRLAVALIENHDGKIPEEFKPLIALPGIGPYTAHALLSSVHGKRVPLVDVNVRRFLSRLVWTMGSTGEAKPEKDIWNLAGELLPRRAYAWNQALMDIGATICTARNPRCPLCPVRSLCKSRSFMRNRTLTPTSREPSRGGFPNRIYRGRIIRELTHPEGRHSISADTLGKKIYSGYSRRDARWLRSLLAALEKDGLVKIRGNGSLATSRVSLA